MKQLLKTFLMMVLIAGSSGHAAPLSVPVTAANFSPTTEPSATLQSSNPGFLPVQQAFQVQARVDDQRLILHWTIADGYYLYRKGFKLNSTSSATQIDEPIFADGVLKWDEYFEAEVRVYYHQTSIEVPFTSNKQLFHIQLESQGCADAGLCYPPHQQNLTVDLSSGHVSISEQPAKISHSGPSDPIASTPLWFILMLAMAGGLILNLMPCVFPVLSIKVLSFTQQHQTPSDKQRHGLAYTLGVVSSFVAIAALMLSLRAGGEAIGWGFQLQSPGFVIFLIYLFTLLGLSLSGYVQLLSSLMSVGQSSPATGSLGSSFMTGVLATTVASPCTAPFMGPALGFAISQTNAVALLVFAFLGLGMALPFVALIWVPSLTSKLPKPGQWMDNLKQFLAFPMYLTAIWLLWVAGRQTSVAIVIAICLGLVLMIMAIWLWQLSSRSTSSNLSILIKLLAAGLFIGAISTPNLKLANQDQQKRWQDYSPQRLTELRQMGKPVFINLSADWCITCLVNERIAMGDSFYQTLDDNNIVYLKGDWTHKDPQITKLLNQYNRNGVPLYLLFPEGAGPAKILPQLLTKSSLINALNLNN